MEKIIEEAKLIMDNIFQKKHILVEEIFYYGSKKIEYEIHYNNTIITISLVDDLSYDFTVYKKDLSKIIYNNTKILLLIDELFYIIQEDINQQKSNSDK